MNKEIAWFLGFLLSDGSIIRPTYRGKGNEQHISFCIHYKDKEVLYKIKDILHTRAKVHVYPNYKSPQAKIEIYDRKDIEKEFYDIKEHVPVEKIKGYERHFIRGLIDGDGCLYYRKNRGNGLMINFIDEKKEIVDWVNKTICKELNIKYKECTYKEKDHIYSISWEGKIGRLIAWWLYHGDIDNCKLERKYQYYKTYVLDNKSFDNYDKELIYAINTFIEDNKINMNVSSNLTLDWCKRLQKYLSFNTTPIFKNKGKTKYYFLHIPDTSIINM